LDPLGRMSLVVTFDESDSAYSESKSPDAGQVTVEVNFPVGSVVPSCQGGGGHRQSYMTTASLGMAVRGCWNVLNGRVAADLSQKQTQSGLHDCAECPNSGRQPSDSDTQINQQKNHFYIAHTVSSCSACDRGLRDPGVAALCEHSQHDCDGPSFLNRN